MIEYLCRACHRPMFLCDAPVGRLRLVCPFRDCRHFQVLHLGGTYTGPTLDRVLAAVAAALETAPAPPVLRNGRRVR